MTSESEHPLPFVHREATAFEPDIFGAVDGFRLPATISGWVVKRQAGQYVSGLRVEICANDVVMAQTPPVGPRPDVTQDDTIAAAFTLDCSAFATTAQLLDGTCAVFAVDAEGQRQQLEIYAPVRQRIEQEMADGMTQAEACEPAKPNAAPRETSPSRPRPRSTGPRIAFIGAGGASASNLLGDILGNPALADSHICLYDIDHDRLQVSHAIAKHLAQALGDGSRVETTTDLGQALDGADYVINMIQLDGHRAGAVKDFEIPNRFGLRQTFGDTLGIGGIMRALRSIPVLARMTAEMENRCPHALHLNYVSPMAMNCWALTRSSSIRTIGLCSSVEDTAATLARDIGLPLEAISYVAAGINRMSFFLSFTSRGEDLYPRIRKVNAEARVPADDRIRYDMLDRTGYFATGSSGQLAEYVPWYIKQGRRELIERFNIPLDDYIRRHDLQTEQWKNRARQLQDPKQPISVVSGKAGARIISAIETNTPTVVHGNVPNIGLIDNLPEGCCVELPCLVDGNGVQPVRIGRLPLHLAALMQANINVQALTVEAAVTGRRDHVYHAAMLDPHTAAELDLDQISRLVDTLLEAHRPDLPDSLFA